MGMDSKFSRGLDELLQIGPRAVFRALADHLDHVSHEVFAEALRWTARQHRADIRDLAVELLERGLGHESPFVRDAAALGLAELLEDDALGPLRRAHGLEIVPELQQDIGDLIASLETNAP